MKLISKFLLLSSALMLLGSACQKNKIYEFPDGWNANRGGDTARITVDTSKARIDRSMFAQARIFPGMIGDAEQRLKNYNLALKIDFEDLSKQAQNAKMSVLPGPQFSTGLYAPAGELITITVPEGATGLSVQVGAHTDDISSIDVQRRYPVIFTQVQLFPGVNYVRNPFGGTIYIKAIRSLGKTVNLTFDGPVKAPDFVLGETNPEGWMDSLKKSTVPWLELRSRNIIFTLPRDKFLRYPLNDPKKLMEEWDKVIDEDYYNWMGFEQTPTNPVHTRPTLPWRVLLDIQPVVGYGHNGYPVIAQMDDPWFTSIININNLSGGAEVTATVENGNNWGIFHEIGHNSQQGSMWSWADLGEVTCNIFVFKSANRKSIETGKRLIPGHISVGKGFAMALQGLKEGKSLSQITDPIARLLPMIQLLEKNPKGYALMTDIYRAAREASRYSYSDQDKKDFLYEQVCKSTGINYIEFFKAWGIGPSNVSIGNIAKLGLPGLENDIWTYNPITGKGGTGYAIISEISKTGWTATISGNASDGGGAAATIDNNLATFWGTPWNGTVPANGEHWLKLDMKQAYRMKGLYWYNRQDNNNGPIKNMDIYVSTTGSSDADFTKIGDWKTFNDGAEMLIGPNDKGRQKNFISHTCQLQVYLDQNTRKLCYHYYPPRQVYQYGRGGSISIDMKITEVKTCKQ